ncbi:hypothetical protein PCE1_000634 [Barthelona sp. PCE]
MSKRRNKPAFGPFQLFLRVHQSKGRCAVAKKNFEVGDVILRERSAVKVLFKHKQGDFCDVCLLPKELHDGNKFCTPQPEFLSLYQRAAEYMDEHGIEDLSIDFIYLALALQDVVNRLSNSVVPASISNESMPLVEPAYRYIKKLVDNFDAVKSMGETGTAPDFFIHYLGVVMSNCHGLQFGLADVGMGLFPRIAMINHSCNPNAILSTVSGSHSSDHNHSSVLEIRAIRPIEANEEITISYVEFPMSDEGQSELEHLFINPCSCESCISGATQQARLLDKSEEELSAIETAIEGKDFEKLAALVPANWQGYRSLYMSAVTNGGGLPAFVQLFNYYKNPEHFFPKHALSIASMLKKHDSRYVLECQSLREIIGNLEK